MRGENIELYEEFGLEILNGAAEGDDSGNFTYVGSIGSSVIDYCIVSEKLGVEVKNFKVPKVIDLDHLPLKLTLKEHPPVFRNEVNFKAKEYILRRYIWNKQSKLVMGVNWKKRKY